MSLLDNVSLASAIRDVATVLGFRLLPFLGFVLATRHLGWTYKALVAASAAAVALVANLHELLPLAWVVATYGYFVGVSALVPLLLQPLRSAQLTRGGLFAACAGVFLVLPGLVLPPQARLAALLIGWDLTLSSYSYVVEVARGRARAARSDCLFFLLVNPALVYVDRGECFGRPRLEGRGLMRAALGLGTLLAASALLVPVCAHVKRHGVAVGSLQAVGLGAVAYAVLRFLLEYARHSGLASLQIGLMRQLGHAIPERYVWPLVARNPMDFWQRWNTYVGGWMARYVFRPALRELKQNVGRTSVATAYGSAVIGTFVATGLLHDVAPYLGETGRVGAGLTAFSLIGLLVVAWVVLTRWLAAILASTRARWLGQVGAITSRVSFWMIAVSCAALLLE